MTFAPDQNGDRDPEVTVVIPTHARWPLLRRTLAGVLRQQDVELEVVVVDDGSDDETHSRLGEVGDPRVRIHRHDTPRGVAEARNAGVALARAPCVAFLDDDDLWSPRKLRLGLDALAGSGAVWAYGAGLVIDERLSVIRVIEPPSPAHLAARLLSANVLPASCSDVIVRTHAVREIGGYDPSFRVLTDYDFNLRLSRVGRAAMYPGHEMAYVQHGANMSVTRVQMAAAEFVRLRAKHAEAGVRLSAAPMWRWIAFNQHRRGKRGAAAAAYLRAALRHGDPMSVVRALVVSMGPNATEYALRRVRSPDRHTAPEWLDAFRDPR